MNKPLTIFVHRASECLTDHESHGDGLICFSLLNGLAERGHTIYAFSNRAPINNCSERLHVKTDHHRVPANSLAPWEYSWKADRWFRELSKTVDFDLVWRMHPYGAACSAVPATDGLPLVVGPLFYSWPSSQPSALGRPRFGVGLDGIARPIAMRGWEKTLSRAALIFCATEAQAAEYAGRYPQAPSRTLPVIVEPPRLEARSTRRFDAGSLKVEAAIAGAGLSSLSEAHKSGVMVAEEPSRPLRLMFIANLVGYKNPSIFCETIKNLRDLGINAEGVIVGDGPERGSLEAYCVQNGIQSAITFLGKVANTVVYEHVASAHFLVSASLGEPYGRGIAEAMSVGTPAVCHRSGGPADFIRHGDDGILVADLTAYAYTQAIAEVISTPDLWTAMSAKAAAKAALWTSEAVLADVESQLVALVREKRAAG